VVVLFALVLVAAVVALLKVQRMLEPAAMRAALEGQATAALGQPVTIGAVELALSLRPRIVLGDVRVGNPTAVTVRRVAFRTGLRALLSRRIEGADLSVEGSRLPLPLPFALGGQTAGPGGADPAPSARTITIDSIDRIALSDIDLVVGERHLRLDLDSGLAGDRLVVSRLRLASARTTVQGHGEVSSVAARRGTFTLVADPLDLDELLAIASGISAAPVSPSTDAAATPPLDLRLEVSAPRGRVLDVPFASLAATIALARDAVVLDPVTVGVFGGALSGRASLATDVTPSRLTMAVDVSSLDVAALAAQAGVGGVMTGRLGGHVDLQAEAGAPAVVFRSAVGGARLAVRDGTIPGLDLVGPAIRAFGTAGAGQLAPGSRDFTSLQGTFTLARGMLQSSDLALHSRDVDLQGRGSLRVSGAVVDVTADLVLSEALSAQAGRDLYRYAREGSRIVLPATVTGPLASPRVFIDIRAAAGRALRNTVEQEMKKALDKLFKP
jgi:hypothetical protein